MEYLYTGLVGMGLLLCGFLLGKNYWIKRSYEQLIAFLLKEKYIKVINFGDKAKLVKIDNSENL